MNLPVEAILIYVIEHSNCCTETHKCKDGEGDCDFDVDCEGDLKCGTKNCGDNFPKKLEQELVLFTQWQKCLVLKKIYKRLKLRFAMTKIYIRK